MDFHSKYLKYKQKYLENKNLNEGGSGSGTSATGTGTATVPKKDFDDLKKKYDELEKEMNELKGKFTDSDKKKKEVVDAAKGVLNFFDKKIVPKTSIAVPFSPTIVTYR